jgi:A/G-specific adenine glycosylase
MLARQFKTKNSKLLRLVPPLLAWFSQNARDLPWRRTRDPYAIWVSEIMLQQTQVKTVLPYYERWMCELPTIAALAHAASEKIHKLWEGLGYYTRVRNLQKAARLILTNHGGVFPRNFDDVLALPGIGRYTAGAICSIAFNQPTPILDGNVIRVLTRVFGIASDPREKKTTALLWQLAEHLVQNSRLKTKNSKLSCSHLNQSLMELGALVCTPRRPDCAACPLARHCQALRQGRVDELPRRRRRPGAIARRVAAFVVEHRGRFLVRRRPAGVVNAHLWEFPNLEVNGELDLRRIARNALGFRAANLRLLCTIRHSITRYRIQLEVHQANPAGNSSRQGGPGRWLSQAELAPLSFSSAHGKILRQLEASARMK